VNAVRWQISAWKNAMIDPEQAHALADGDAVKALAAGLYSQYQRHLKAYNAVDFDDLIFLPVKLFQHHPEVLDAWQNRIRYLLVDEYQDTNTGQYQLVRALTGPRGALTAVGDDDQSIYAWRGAQPENLGLLQQDFPHLKVIKLEQNYRSTGRILKAANRLIANNSHVFAKSLWCELGYGDPLRVIETRSDEHEAEVVVSEILSHKFKHRTDFRDYAILYRGNHQARPFEKALARRIYRFRHFPVNFVFQFCFEDFRETQNCYKRCPKFVTHICKEIAFDSAHLFCSFFSGNEFSLNFMLSGNVFDSTFEKILFRFLILNISGIEPYVYQRAVLFFECRFVAHDLIFTFKNIQKPAPVFNVVINGIHVQF